MNGRAAVADLHERIRAGELGAVNRARRHLLERTWATGSAAELRYLLRVLADAGLLGTISLNELLAEALRCLEVAWPKGADDDDDDDGEGEERDLNALCASVESCALSQDGRGWNPARLKDPVLRVAGHVVRHCVEEPDLQPILQRTANAVALVCGQAAPEDQRANARAEVYRRILERVATSLLETDVDPARDAAHLVRWLDEVGMIRLTSDDASRTALEARIAGLRELPAQARPEALEELLLSDPRVEEVFATRADLARVLADWG